MSPPRRGLPAIFLLFFLSGATSLIYQVVWLRLLILIFGSTQFATSTILSCFMGGLALGAFLGGRWLDRSRLRPLRVYGALEVGIGVYAVIVPTLFQALTPIYRVVWDAGGSESFVLLSLAKFVGIAAVLLPPTALMGASLPALAREVAHDERRIGGTVGALYAINTFGAVGGVLIAGFFAIPGVGVHATIWATASVNLALGLVAIVLARGIPFRQKATEPDGRSARRTRTPGRVRLALVVFGVSGFGALVLEVAWTRVLALLLGSSVYAFSLMLLAFLIGLAAGGAWFAGLLRRRPDVDPARLLAWLLGAAGILAYATAHSYPLLPRLFTEIFQRVEPDPTLWFVVQLLFGLIVMFPATFALGGVFPAVLQLHARSLDRVAASVGTVYAANTVGTILGAALAGFVLIPRLGVMPTVLSISVMELLLGLVVAFWLVSASRRRQILIAALMAGLVLMVAVRPRWDVILMHSGLYMHMFDGDDPETWAEVVEGNRDVEVVYAAEGHTVSVLVADQHDYGSRYLAVNGKIDASTSADLETQLMAAHIPLLLHESPTDVMIIGLASGITVGAAATHPVENIRVVELEQVMVEAARKFGEHNDHVMDDPRVQMSFNDARNELEFSSDTYDVIISEPSNPWMTVAANLFTEEFFRMARTRVRPGGIFCQWVQNYYLPTEDMRSIVAAFRDSFPHVMLFETYDGIDLLLLGSESPLSFDLEAIHGRMSELRVRMDLKRLGISHPLHMVSLFRLGSREIDRMVDGAPRNTDDNARVEFSAPKSLGLYTISRNQALLRQYAGDLLDYLEPPVVTAEDRDTLRLSLARTWLDRDNPDLAAWSAEQVSDGPLREVADELLAQIRRPDAKL